MKTLLTIALVLATSTLAAAAPPCPSAVTDAIAKKFAKSTVQTCKAEREAGHDQFEVVLTKAFAAKYPKAKATRAEKQTPAAGKPSYELAFQADGKRKEATFGEDGAFVEEE